MHSLEETFARNEAQVDALLKQCEELRSALKQWKRACADGAVGDRQKHAERVQLLAAQVGPAVQEVANEWGFDARDYLESGAWRAELLEAAKKHPSSPKVLVEGNELVCSPIVIRPEPNRFALRLGKARWTKLRPRKVVDELVRIRMQGGRHSLREFLDSLWTAVQYLNRGGAATSSTAYAKLRDIYDLFCLTPGWKKENSEAAFAQYLYALHRSDIQATRSEKRYEFEFPTGQPKAKDVFEVIAEDGRSIRYYIIHFR